ncbi:MAG TPA: hypothetical protein ENN03_11265 [bacterium]|nr:hypothetical protein [bacterium]
MINLRFDFRDLFRSARVAFSFQRLWIQGVGVIVGLIGYGVFTYFSLLVSGKPLSEIWHDFGVLPWVVGLQLHWIGWVIYAAGCLILLFIWLVTATAVSRAAYMHLKGNTFYTWKEAFRFALKKKGGSVISTPLAILVIAVLLGAGGLFIGLLGRIPVVGPIGISLFAVAWFMAALFLIFTLLALAVSLILTPAVLAATDDDAFEGIFQSYSILHAQPWRLIFYEILTVVVAAVGFGLLAFFAKRGWLLMTTLFIRGMGESFADISYAASALLQQWIHPAADWFQSILGQYSGLFSFAHDFETGSVPLIISIASWIFAVFMLLITLFIAAYPLAVFNSGQTLIFLVLKNKKDDENLLERKDQEESFEEEIETLEAEEPEKEEKPSKKKTASPKKPVKKKKE